MCVTIRLQRLSTWRFTVIRGDVAAFFFGSIRVDDETRVYPNAVRSAHVIVRRMKALEPSHIALRQSRRPSLASFASTRRRARVSHHAAHRFPTRTSTPHTRQTPRTAYTHSVAPGLMKMRNPCAPVVALAMSASVNARSDARGTDDMARSARRSLSSELPTRDKNVFEKYVRARALVARARCESLTSVYASRVRAPRSRAVTRRAAETPTQFQRVHIGIGSPSSLPPYASL